MSAEILDGKLLSQIARVSLKREVDGLREKYKMVPNLAAIQIGDNPESNVYIEQQRECAYALGIEYNLHKLGSQAKKEEVLRLIEDLNDSSIVSGIIFQLPLPSHLDFKELIPKVSALKDVEGLHPENLGRLIAGNPYFVPCTALSIVELIKHTKIELYGKEVVVVGHSEIVGKPTALLLLNEFATTTVCHIATSEKGKLSEHTKRADVLVVAVGEVGLIKGENIKEGAIVIDAGINKVVNKIIGDCEFESVSKVASYITPVPGGVGPLTVVMLMKNILAAFKLRRE